MVITTNKGHNSCQNIRAAAKKKSLSHGENKKKIFYLPVENLCRGK